ncbi:unnamed protein product [Closterium sp. NIES-64]|nr:unnamed protein product [Closterium sp. NIES-65]CAI5954058.1 unnamed protein product [Closterium sp. NIES-64]
MASTPSLLAVAASLRQSAGGMAGWSLEDLTLGLYRLSLKHAAGKDVDAIPGDVVRNRNDLEEMLHWLRWAMSAYETDAAALATHLRIPQGAIHRHVGTSAVHRPAHFVAVSEERRCVVVGVRGTSHPADVLTDLCSHAAAFADGHAHAGMLEAAKWVAQSQGQLIAQLLSQNPGYSLVTVGHSLGAGTAALLAMLLRHPPSLPALSLSLSPHLLPAPALSPFCWAFACPCIVSQDLAETAFFIRTVVLQDDIVPRMSTAALSDLRTEILSTDWAAVVRDNPAAARLASLASSTQTALESSLGISQGQLLPTLSSHAASFFRSVSTPAASAGGGGGGGGGAGGAGWLAFAGRVAASVSAAVETQATAAHEASAASAAPPVRLVAPGQLFHILRKPPSSLQQQFNLPPPPTNQSKQPHQQQQQQDVSAIGIAKQGGNARWLAAHGGLTLTPSVGLAGNGGGSGRPKASGEEQLFVEEETNMETRGMFDGDTQQGGRDSGNVGGEATLPVLGSSISHVVVRGFDPKSRLSRIILSNNLLADHSCKLYGKGIIDAMQWCL